MENKYKEINIPADLNNDDNDLEVVVEDIENSEEKEQEKEEVVLKKEEEKPKEVKPVQRRPSRAQKRIRELNYKANELEAQLEKERKEKYELMKKLNEGSKQGKENTKAALQAQITSLNNQLRQAMQAGDTDSVVKIQDQLIDAKTEMKVIDIELSNVEEVEEYKPEPKTAPISEHAEAWMEEQHSNLRQDPQFANAAYSINESLLREGFDYMEEEFYDELSLRLSRRFPHYFKQEKETFVPQEENVVEYIDETSSVKDVKPKIQVEVKRPQAPQQTVSGASRTANAAVNRQPDNNRVRLTQTDLEQIDRWDMPMERIARRKLHMEKNRRDDGYVPIFIPTETNR